MKLRLFLAETMEGDFFNRFVSFFPDLTGILSFPLAIFWFTDVFAVSCFL